MDFEIGAQLYTIRDFCQTPEDFDKSMARVSAIGYKNIQISAIGDFGAKKIKDIADKHGLSIIITHTNQQKIKDKPDEVIEDHNIMGAKYIGIGSMPSEYHGSSENIKKFISDYMPVAKKFRDAGLKLMYHNHSFEFEKFDGKSMFDMLDEGFNYDTDNPLMGFIVDVFWIQHGGGDPAFWLKKLRGRVDCVHFKDMKIQKNQQKMCEVMEGNLNWNAIIKASEESGVKWAFVEQDDSNGLDPFYCLETSFRNLTNYNG